MNKKSEDFRSYITPPLESVVENSTEQITPITPSKNIDKKIQTMINNASKKQPRILHIPLRRLVLSTLTLCILFVFVGWAVLPPLYGANSIEYETHIDYIFAQTPKEELKYLGFTCIPEYIPLGYTQYEVDTVGDSYSLTFRNEENNEIVYKEYSATNVALDNEYEKQEVVTVSNGISAYLVEKEGISSISWFDPQYNRIYRISGSISKKEILKIAKNLIQL